MLVSSSRTYFPVYAVCPVRCLRELSISLATFRNHATQRCARESVATATEPCRRTLLFVARVMQISSCAVYEPYYTTCERSVPLQQIRSASRWSSHSVARQFCRIVLCRMSAVVVATWSRPRDSNLIIPALYRQQNHQGPDIDSAARVESFYHLSLVPTTAIRATVT